VSTESESQVPATIAYTIRGAVAASGFSRSRIYELIARGEVEARKDGRKTLVVAASLAAYISALPNYRDHKAELKAAVSIKGGA